MASYMSVERSSIQTGRWANFTEAELRQIEAGLELDATAEELFYEVSEELAIRCGLRMELSVCRKRFKEIATEIWKACGEQTDMPAALPEEMKALAKNPEAR